MAAVVGIGLLERDVLRPSCRAPSRRSGDGRWRCRCRIRPCRRRARSCRRRAAKGWRRRNGRRAARCRSCRAPRLRRQASRRCRRIEAAAAAHRLLDQSETLIETVAAIVDVVFRRPTSRSSDRRGVRRCAGEIRSGPCRCGAPNHPWPIRRRSWSAAVHSRERRRSAPCWCRPRRRRSSCCRSDRRQSIRRRRDRARRRP